MKKKDIHKMKMVFYPNNVANFTQEDLEYARAVFFADFTVFVYMISSHAFFTKSITIIC